MSGTYVPPDKGGIFTLDLARITGWAYGCANWRSPMFGTWHMPLIGGEGMRFAAFENELEAALEELEPLSIVCESPLPLPAVTNRAAVQQQLGMRAFVKAACYRASIECTEVSADLVRMELLGFCRAPGRPEAIKNHVVAYCRRKGWKVPDHNAGDACLLWEWKRRRVSGSVPMQRELGAIA
jgi:hypothetical protein